MEEYKIGPKIRIKETDKQDVFEVAGISEEPIQARIYSCPLSAFDLYVLESDPYKWKESAQQKASLTEGIIIGQHALIEDLKGKPKLYTADTIEKLLG
ncbi:MAG: hypothetical protein Q8N77_04375 [Nanoarchaeota archaeon]|nr:hypothetical protein [Nanoarchaeota archaeon]